MRSLALVLPFVVGLVTVAPACDKRADGKPEAAAAPAKGDGAKPEKIAAGGAAAKKLPVPTSAPTPEPVPRDEDEDSAAAMVPAGAKKGELPPAEADKGIDTATDAEGAVKLDKPTEARNRGATADGDAPPPKVAGVAPGASGKVLASAGGSKEKEKGEGFAGGGALNPFGGTLSGGGGVSSGAGAGVGGGGSPGIAGKPETGGRAARPPASGKVSILGKPTVTGDFDPNIVHRMMRRNLSSVRYCYVKALQTNPQAAGVVGIKFLITPEGRVGAASVSKNTVGDAKVASCISARLRRVAYPKPKKGRVLVGVTFKLVPAPEPNKDKRN